VSASVPIVEGTRPRLHRFVFFASINSLDKLNLIFPLSTLSSCTIIVESTCIFLIDPPPIIVYFISNIS